MSVRNALSFFILFSCASLLHAVPVTAVKAENPLNHRKPGENVSFRVEVTENGSLLKSGVLEIEIQENGLCVKKMNVNLATDGNPKEITATMRNPGFLTCRTWTYESAEKKKIYLYGRDTVPFEPEKIQTAAEPPADFDAFWSKAFQSARKTVPDFRVTPLEKSDTKTHKAYLLSFSLGEGRMYGFLSVPSDGGEKKYPAVLRIPGAGPGFTAVRHQTGAITLQMNIHFIDPSDKTSFQNEYAKLDKPRPYQTRGTAEPERYYLSRVVPGLCRAAEFLAAHPAWNGKSLIAAGSSQGGALSLMTAAFQEKITAVSASIPALCDQNGRLAGRMPGWPGLYGSMSRFEKQLSEAEKTKICGYFDLVNFVPKIKVPVNMNCGAIDLVCPPHTVYAAYNRIRAPKEIMIMAGTSHAVSSEGRRKNDEFLKKEFAK